MNETIKIWIENFKSSGKTIEEEIEEIKGTISNEKLWSNSDSIHFENIALLEEYLEYLEDLKIS